MSDQPPKVIKRKVKPYPFEAMLEVDTQKMSVEVIFLNHLGVIVRLNNQIVHVGTYYQILFEIPVSREFVNAQTRVLKTYDKSLDIKEKTVERLAELHFQNLTKEQRARIKTFMAMIGQEKR